MTLPEGVAWAPLPGSQSLALSCPCHHILFDGTRGPGKTDAQLMRFRMTVGKGYGAFWRGVIFDREYKNLDDIVAKANRWFSACGDGARFLRSTSDYKWVWPTGEELLFRCVENVGDYWKHHGQEYPFIGWNELTKFPDSELYDMMMSCNRSSFVPEAHKGPNGETLPELPLTVFSTTNPFGPGHNWVKSKFIDCAPAGVPIRRSSVVFDPRIGKEREVVKTQVRIFGSYRENRYLSAEYVAELDSITDPNRRKAWLDGDWDIVAGGVIDDLWRPAVHILPRFPIPANWRLDRSFDWGSAKPFSVGWWAEANGETVQIKLSDGSYKPFCPVKGSLIRFDEWYGSAVIGSNVGLRMTAKDVAVGIKEREKRSMSAQFISSKPWGGPADNSIHNVLEGESESIATKMLSKGVAWEHSDKKAGSRINGLQLLRDRLQAALTGEGPAIYFMDNCRATIALLPVLPRDPKDPDDADSEAEDHCYDEIRYRCLAGTSRQPGTVKVRRLR